MPEVPWFNAPPEAVLHWSVLDARVKEEKRGFLHFYDPEGNRAVVPVTFQPAHWIPTWNSDGTEGEPTPIWQIEISQDGKIATVRDSVHYIDHWHSPNPVLFNLVKELHALEDRS